MKENVTIEKGTVQETLMLPLYGRYMANQRYPQLFKDVAAKKIIDRIDYNIGKADMGKGPQIVYGLRQDLTARSASRFLEKYPEAIVVNIGCGLDTIFSHIDNGKCRFVNIDFPEVIQFRQKLFDSNDRITDIGMDANNLEWMDCVGYQEGDHVFLMSCGVLMYFQRPQVKKLIDEIGKHFPGAVFCFDYENARMLARSNRAVRKTGNNGALMPFSMEDGEKEIKEFSDTVDYIIPLKALPKEYDVLPFIYRMYFNRVLRSGAMVLVDVKFKEAV